MALERYFEQQVTLPDAASEAFTAAERAFVERYMGADFERVLAKGGIPEPARVESVGGSLPASSVAAPQPLAASCESNSSAADEDQLEAALQEARELKLVGFRVRGQELAVPIAQVQEVIRAVPMTRLPAAPPHILGIMNLRGRVVPLLSLASLVGGSTPEGEGRFIVVCRRRDMLLGLVVEAIAAMHQVQGEDVEWGVEARVGVAGDLIAGLLKVGDLLVKVLSVDSLFQKVLKN